MTDIRANLVDVQLDEVGEAVPESTAGQEEPDPIEEEVVRPHAAPVAEAETMVVVVTPAGQVDVDPALEALVKLFGADLGTKVWNREGIKLDPTVDRGLFTDQLRQAMAFVDVKVMDHFIIAGRETLSMAERGLI